MKIIGTMEKIQRKKFTDLGTSPDLRAKLMVSSRSAADLNMRLNAYDKANENLALGIEILESRRRKHSGSGIDSLSGLSAVHFMDATVAAMIKSIVGFLAVERSLDAPVATLPFVNVLNTEDDSVHRPNIGQDKTLDSSRKVVYNAEDPTGKAFNAAFGAPLVPGSVEVTLTSKAQTVGTDPNDVDYPGGTHVAKDDGQGRLLFSFDSGITKGTVDYVTGAVTFNTAFDLSTETGQSWTIVAIRDVAKSPNNRLKGGLSYYDFVTSPETIIAEQDVVSSLVAKKSMGIDMVEVMKTRVTDEYTKMINKSVVDAINLNYTGNEVNINLSGYSIGTNDFNSVLRLFVHGLTQVDTFLTDKSYHSVNTSAYLVGAKVAEWFKSLSNIGSFVQNLDATYIEDLLGWFNGIPVVKSHRIAGNVGFAIHKTKDGQMAPAARGIFLPVNDLPEVGNFNNPTQFATGIYSYEGSRLLTSQLVQKFKLTVPSNVEFSAA